MTRIIILEAIKASSAQLYWVTEFCFVVKILKFFCSDDEMATDFKSDKSGLNPSSAA